MGDMNTSIEITADTVRQHLLARAKAYCEAKNTSFSAIGKEAISDDRFLARVERGDNFTLSTYQRVIDWIDAKEALGERAA
jgi:hypothetical protein